MLILPLIKVESFFNNVAIFTTFKILVLSALLGYAYSAPIIRQEQEQNPDGSYRYCYETSNGIKVKQECVVENAGTDQEKKVRYL